MLKRLRLDFAMEEANYSDLLVQNAIKDMKELIESKGVIMNEGKEDEEKPFFNVHDCNHETNEPCVNKVNLLV